MDGRLWRRDLLRYLVSMSTMVGAVIFAFLCWLWRRDLLRYLVSMSTMAQWYSTALRWTPLDIEVRKEKK